MKIKGNVVAKNLSLGGSFSEIDGDVTVTGALIGYYNHGQMRIRGKTRAPLVLASDYEFIFEGAVERKYVASWGGRLNIPVDYDRDRLDRILTPEVIDETNFINDGVILDRLSRGLPILRPEGEIGTPAPPRLSDKGAARLAELRARKERGETIGKVDLKECELRFVPDQLREFSGARELVLTNNRVKKLPSWIGEFQALETLGLEDCGLETLPREIAALPRLRNLDLTDNPITSLPFGPDSFRTVEILSIGENYSNRSAAFTANLDLSLFPWLRVVEQHYDINTVEELVYRDSQELWSNPHLEILNISWAPLKHGIPAGLLRARNLRALATRVNAVQLGSFLWRGPAFERLEYLSIGYTDLSQVQLARLYDGLPRAFISCEKVEGKSGYDFPESDRLSAVDKKLSERRFAEALADERHVAVHGRVLHHAELLADVGALTLGAGCCFSGLRCRSHRWPSRPPTPLADSCAAAGSPGRRRRPLPSGTESSAPSISLHTPPPTGAIGPGEAALAPAGIDWPGPADAHQHLEDVHRHALALDDHAAERPHRRRGLQLRGRRRADDDGRAVLLVQRFEPGAQVHRVDPQLYGDRRRGEPGRPARIAEQGARHDHHHQRGDGRAAEGPAADAAARQRGRQGQERAGGHLRGAGGRQCGPASRSRPDWCGFPTGPIVPVARCMQR